MTSKKSEMPYIVVYTPETVLESLAKDVGTFACLFTAMFFTQGSTLWAGVIIFMGTCFLYAKAARMMRKDSLVFRSRDALQHWINDLPEDV